MTRKLDLHDIQSFVMRGHGKDYSLGRHYLLEIDAEIARQAAARQVDEQQPGQTEENDGTAAADSETAAGTRIGLYAFLDWLRDQVTTAAPWRNGKPDSIINVALTYAGLEACGVPVLTLSGLPSEFREGMRERRQLLGDDADYETWDPAWKPGDEGGTVHLLVMHMLNTNRGAGADKTHRSDQDILEEFAQELRERGPRAGIKLLKHPSTQRGEPDQDWLEVGHRQRQDADQGSDVTLVPELPKEHFGFVDGISDPVFDGQDEAHIERKVIGRGKRSADGTWTPLATGEFLLGYPDEAQEQPPAPRPGDFSRNCTFLVYRKLHQNIQAFDEYIDSNAKRYLNYLQQVPQTSQPEQALLNLHAAKQTLKAKMMGRWPDGTSLLAAPDWASWQKRCTAIQRAQAEGDAGALKRFRQEMVDFTYLEEDADGRRCPLGSHIRRSNPRDSLDPAPPLQPTQQIRGPKQSSSTVVNNRRRILRRGIGYGDRKHDEHGLIFIALCANLFRQFEFIQQQWIQYGREFEAGSDSCPISGQRPAPEHSSPGAVGEKFVLPPPPGVEREPFLCTRLQPFVNCRGGAYFYVPSLTCLRLIAQGMTDAT